MKRILTLFILGIFAYQAKAQVIFFQDFESGSLDPMTAVDVDGLTVNPSVATIAGPTFQVVQQTATNKMAVSTSWFDPVGQADDWLISPPIEITDANTFLSWEAYSPDGSYRDGYQVRVSTTDNEIASFSNLALNVAAELTTLTKRSVKLGAYVGQTIYFAFRNNSNDKYLLFMDNIKVEVLKNNNPILKTLTLEKYNSWLSPTPIAITVENHGANPLTSIIFDYTIADSTYTDTVVGLNIAPLKTSSITHSLDYAFQEGEFTIDANISFPNGVDDDDPSDNTISKVVYGLGGELPKKILVEEATGTWCQWCPRGAVNMDLLVDEFPDIIMPVAVHNFDPMTIDEYDGPMSASIGGYPSGHIDRKIKDIDPLDFRSSAISLQHRKVPLTVETNVTWDPATRTATIVGTGSLQISTQHNSLRFNCIITENNVTGDNSDWSQVNAYAGGGAGVMGGYENLPNPVPYTQMVYNYVARAILGGFDGFDNSISPVLPAFEDFQFEFSYNVPDEYNVDEMKAIVVVMDSETGEILNGDIQKLGETTSVPVIPDGHSSIYPNPTTDILNLDVDYQTDVHITMKVYDTNGRLVRDFGALDLSSGPQTQQLNVADLASGNYILELRNKNAVTALPFNKI